MPFQRISNMERLLKRAYYTQLHWLQCSNFSQEFPLQKILMALYLSQLEFATLMHDLAQTLVLMDVKFRGLKTVH